jgi:hypothetical protein
MPHFPDGNPFPLSLKMFQLNRDDRAAAPHIVQFVLIRAADEAS